MSLLVVGTDGPLARALVDAVPPVRPDDVVAALARERPTQLAIIGLPAPAGALGAIATETLADLIEQMLHPAFAALRAAAAADAPLRIALVCPAAGVLPDHRDGARSVVAAGLAMVGEVAAAAPALAVNVIAIADDVPADEAAATVRFALSDQAPSLNGATIRLDGGRDAVLAAETRSEGD